MVKIFYNKKQTNQAFVMGMLTVIVGIASQYATPNYIFSGFIGLGIVYLGIFFMQKFSPYVLITKEYMVVDGLPRKKIFLKDITEIKYFAGDYIVKNVNKEVVINTNFVDKESLPALQQFIDDFTTK